MRAPRPIEPRILCMIDPGPKSAKAYRFFDVGARAVAPPVAQSLCAKWNPLRRGVPELERGVGFS